jgi:uncharacterized repeat protein (TIGR03803 family)
VLHNFTGSPSDGYEPQSGVIFDKSGNLYGTTYYGGDYSACQKGGCGVVFELSPVAGAWSESLLYAFHGTGDGNGPSGALVFDKSGALYGATSGEGVYNNGNVFKLSPPAVQGGQWTESVLYAFGSSNGSLDGYDPGAGVIFEGKNLYGTTVAGGSGSCSYNGGVTSAGCGTVFELAPPRTGAGSWTEKILWNCAGSDTDGSHAPEAALTLRNGAFYGTTSGGNGNGPCQFGCGAVFKLVP